MKGGYVKIKKGISEGKPYKQRWIMIIEELHVKNFGKLQDTKVPFEKGLNLIYGANESGKTTLHTFLKCMLFGMRRSRGRGAAKDVYSRYEPWEYGHYYAGAMRFESGGKVFCLDRNFQKDNVRAELFCMTDGEKLSVKRGDLSMLLGNVSEIVYDNTVSIGQTKGVTDQDLALELRNYMANYQGTGDSDLDLNKTMQILKDQKKSFQGELKLKKANDDARKSEVASQTLYLNQEVHQLREKIQNERSQLVQLKEERESQEGEKPQEKLKKQIGRRKTFTIAAVGVVVFLAVAMALLPGLIRIGAAVAGTLLLWGCLLGRGKAQKKVSALKDSQQEEMELLTRQMERVKGRLHNQEEELKEKKLNLEMLTQKLHEYNREIKSIHGKDPLEEEVEGIDMAMEVIGMIGQRLQNEVGSQIRSRTSEVLAELTRGKYHQVVIDSELQMGVSAQDRYIPVEQLSRGTMEQVYFALRMAVGDILCSQEVLPVVLDDVFVMYDEVRLMETLQWLIEHKQQVLLFTCHKREEQILNDYGLTYHRVGVFDS